MTAVTQDDVSALATEISETLGAAAGSRKLLDWIVEQLKALSVELDHQPAKAREQVTALATLLDHNTTLLSRSIGEQPNDLSEAELAAQTAADDAEVATAVATVRADQAERHLAEHKTRQKAADKADGKAESEAKAEPKAESAHKTTRTRAGE